MDGGGSAGGRASRGAEGPFADATYLTAIFAGPAIAWLGTWQTPGPKLVPVLISSGLTAAALGDFIWLAYTWAGLEPDVSLADIFYYAGYLGLGAAMLVIVLQHRQDVRRVDVDAAIDALTVVTVSVLVLWSVAVHGIVTDDSMSATTRAVLAGYPVADAVLLALVLRVLSVRRHREALGFRFAVGVACWLVSDLGYLLFLVSGHGVGHPRRRLDGRRHPDCHLHVASSESDCPRKRSAEQVRAPLGQLGLADPPAAGPPGPARRHLRPRRGDPPRRRGRRDAHPDRRHLRPHGPAPAVREPGPARSSPWPATPHWRRPGPSRRSSPR